MYIFKFDIMKQKHRDLVRWKRKTVMLIPIL